MIKMTTFQLRGDWLNRRSKRIGGSDAACIIGLNPWRSNVELWEIKTGRRQQADISQEPVVMYGTQAEKHLRELFKLDFPQYTVEYIENNIWFNDKFPFAHASLDGWLTDNEGRSGVLEIKTTNIQSKAMAEKWKDKIPNQYYVQVLHYLMVLDADFAVVKAQLKYDYGDGDVFLNTRHYFIERADVQSDIDYLAQAEKEFAEILEADNPPPLILPRI